MSYKFQNMAQKSTIGNVTFHIKSIMKNKCKLLFTYICMLYEYVNLIGMLKIQLIKKNEERL